MPMPAIEIEALIRSALPDAEIELVALADDDDHWAAHVRSARFAGMSRVRQHQLVYAALGDRMGGALHALQLTTSTPANRA
jgi:stress-induced morphogen